LADGSKPSELSVQRGRSREADKAWIQLYPVNNPDFGHWAYIDDILIRMDRAGITTIIDMSQVFQNGAKVWTDGEGKR
jgi:hypothetical protein